MARSWNHAAQKLSHNKPYLFAQKKRKKSFLLVPGLVSVWLQIFVCMCSICMSVWYIVVVVVVGKNGHNYCHFYMTLECSFRADKFQVRTWQKCLPDSKHHCGTVDNSWYIMCFLSLPSLRGSTKSNEHFGAFHIVKIFPGITDSGNPLLLVPILILVLLSVQWWI